RRGSFSCHRSWGFRRNDPSNRRRLGRGDRQRCPGSRGHLAAARPRQSPDSLTRENKLPAGAVRTFSGDFLEFWIGGERVTLDVAPGLVPHEALVGAHFVLRLVVG